MPNHKRKGATGGSQEAARQMGMFGDKSKKPKVLKEEKMAIKALRKVYFKELEEEIKQELGDEYTEQDAENIFEMFVEEARQTGTIKRMLDKYLQWKIQKERAKFT